MTVRPTDVDALEAIVREAIRDYRTHSFGDGLAHSRAKDADAALSDLAALARRYHVSSQSSPGDPVGHDGFECEPGCDACAFAAEAGRLREQNEPMEKALREIAEDMEGVIRAQAVVDSPAAASDVPRRVRDIAVAALACPDHTERWTQEELDTARETAERRAKAFGWTDHTENTT